MKLLVNFVRAVSALNTAIGNVVSWLALGIVVVCFTVVVQRYVFHFSIIWMQDLYIWLNGAMFTAVAGFALLRNNHVRVDIFYRPASTRKKAILDIIGVVVFLLPSTFVITYYAWPFVTRSWRIGEGSANVGGLPGLFVLKSFILVFAALVALQGLSWVARAILVLRGEETLLPEKLRYQTEES